MKWAGNLVGKGEAKVADAKQAYQDAKQEFKDNISYIKQSTARAAQNAAHPINYVKTQYQAGVEEARRENELARLRMENERKFEEIKREYDEKRQAAQQKAGAVGAAVTMAAAETGPLAPAIGGAVGGAISHAEQGKLDKREEKEEKKLKKKEEDMQKKEAEQARLDDLRRGPINQSHTVNASMAMVLLALVAHLLTSLPPSGGPNWFIILTLYFGVLIISFFNNQIREARAYRRLLGVIFGWGVVVPFLYYKYGGSIDPQLIKVIGAVIIFLPFHIFYLIYHLPQDGWAKKIAQVYIIFCMTVAFFYLMLSPTMVQLNSASGSPPILPMQLVSIVGKAVWNVFADAGHNVQTFFAKAVAAATGQEYHGEEESQSGIYLSDIKPVESKYYSTSDVFVSARIKAVNIKQALPIKNKCYVPDNMINGVTTPAEMQMINNDENIIDCHIGVMKPGAYELRFISSFPFETDADVTYYFVDNSVNPQLYMKSGVPTTTVAKYTGGPVELGLESSNAILRINSTSPDLGRYSFGVSLKNKWPQGHVVRGNRYVLEVPAGIELTGCTRSQTACLKPAPEGRNQYCFAISQLNARELFDSVSCRIKVSNPGLILGSNLEMPQAATFTAKAYYEYAVEGSTFLNIEKDFTGR